MRITQYESREQSTADGFVVVEKLKNEVSGNALLYSNNKICKVELDLFFLLEPNTGTARGTRLWLVFETYTVNFCKGGRARWDEHRDRVCSLVGYCLVNSPAFTFAKKPIETHRKECDMPVFTQSRTSRNHCVADPDRVKLNIICPYLDRTHDLPLTRQAH